MNLDHVFKKTNKRILGGSTRRPEVPEGLLSKCNMCGGAIVTEDVKKNYYICPRCKGYFRVHARERVRLSRDKKRPRGHAYIAALFEDFYELHGDRLFSDDSAVLGGIATFLGRPVTVISQEKDQNFGMCSPDGYRKALRLMHQAEKFGRPVICFVDTPGAACGVEAEERGQGEAIARNIYEMSALKVPVLSVIIGEGGSGGALALAVGNEVWMLENSVYSILSPEGFASILWKDSKRAKHAAECMRLTAAELKASGMVERVFPEPEHFTEENLYQVTASLERAVEEFLNKYGEMSGRELAEQRYHRFRQIGTTEKE